MVVGKVAWTLFSLVFVGAGLFVVNLGRKSRAQARRIAETETTPVRDLEPGTTELVGTATTGDEGETVTAPMSGREALAYRVEVQRYHTSEDGHGSWTTAHAEQAAVPFLVDDGTGEGRVDPPTGGRFDFESDPVDGEEADRTIDRYLREADVDLGEGGSRRYVEGVLEPGEDAYVLGETHEDPDGWGETRYVVTGGSDPGAFVLSDKSGEQLRSEGNRKGLYLYVFGVLFAAVGAVFAVVPWAFGV